MKYYKLLLIIVLFFATNIFAQEKFVNHIVKKGETITSIANQYKIEPSLIYELNPDCSRVLKLQSILLIPNTTSKPTPKKVEPTSILSSTSHQVQSKETLFSIAKQYQISLDELYNANPLLKENGLKAGQKISIPDMEPAKNNLTFIKEEVKDKTLIKEKQVKEVSPSNAKPLGKTIVHEVLQSETKFGIAKQYGITVTDLDKANPILEKEALKTGQKITIPLEAIETVATFGKQTEPVVNKVVAIKEKTKEELSKVKNEPAENHNQQTVIHEVLTKETKFGIAKKYGITIEELENQNPEITKNLYVGAKLTISGANPTQQETTDKKEMSSAHTNAETQNEDQNLTIANSLAKWNTNEELANELVRMASVNLGSRYSTGGTSKNGFDCSGLMCTTFGSIDIKLPRSSIEQSSIGTKVSMEEAKKGDLIFFKTNGGNQINHVGMVVEVCDGEIRFIHSASHSGVIISSTKEKYYQKNFTQINRVLQQ